MAVELGKINTRSSYYLTESAPSGFLIKSAIFYIYIYKGTRDTDLPAEPTFVFKRTSGTQQKVSINIAPIINDYLETTFNGNYEDEVVFVDYKRGEMVFINESTGALANQNADAAISKQGIAYYGYGYFEDGYNPTNEKLVMLDGNRIIKLCNKPFKIPIDIFYGNNTTDSTTIEFYQDGNLVLTQIISASDQSTDIISYSGIDSFEDYVLGLGGTFEDSACLQNFINDNDVYAIDSVVVTMGNNTETISVVNVCECLYTPIKLTFYNKYGALQDFWFFKGGKTSISLESETFRRSIGDDSGMYNTYEHQYKGLAKLGKETMKIYSGFYPESHNETFRQLLLSEDVWATINDVVYPVNIKTESHNFGTRIRDGVMTFDIEIELAYDKINRV